MTKWGIHPMVILWSSYGDPMVWVLFWGYMGGIWGFLGARRSSAES